MQEASGQPHQGPRVTEGTLYSLSDIKYVYLPVSGKVVFSFQTKSRLCFPSPACSLSHSGRLTRSGLIGSSLESDGAAIIVGRVVVVDIAVVVDINKVRGVTRCG